MTSTRPLSQDEAADVLLKYVYSGVIGHTKGMAVDYALMRTTDSTFTYLATIEPLDDVPMFLDKYKIEVDRRSKETSVPRKVEIADKEMKESISAATHETVSSSSRFIDGGFSISYKVTVLENPNIIYIVQLRFHGQVSSIDALMKFVRAHNAPDLVPMPAVYSIPGEAERQHTTGFGRQITQFVPGIMAEQVYPNMSHLDRLKLVRSIALAWQACWDLPLPLPCQIGELIANEDINGKITLNIGPDRHYSLGGPFTSVREWLQRRIRQAVSSLERASGIDDFKDDFLLRIRTFVDNRLDRIPETVEECPVVAIHADMGLHNIIVSESNYSQIEAIIDWELCASAPFLAPLYCIEMLFRMGAPNGFGIEYPRADELRTAFWDAIPKWKGRWERQSTKDFLEWYRFALFLKPEYCSKDKSKAEKMEFWAENVRVVDGMLCKYS